MTVQASRKEEKIKERSGAGGLGAAHGGIEVEGVVGGNRWGDGAQRRQEKSFF